ncbi:hypothetical protein DPEC_G00115410 [Dallia pectoralis]|uniref:Uncharacterized protein n=1 Tax=Dallia pectoralis TaxID=75939 RepID=A0ACC2GU52_DALPE|nr:hypothetical protein DPEC_G00115410 [Dallia pectoralis]
MDSTLIRVVGGVLPQIGKEGSPCGETEESDRGLTEVSYLENGTLYEVFPVPVSMNLSQHGRIGHTRV